MKKLVKSIILGMAAASVMFMAAGCGGGAKQAASSAPAKSQAQGDLLAQIKKKGVLTVGTASGFPPYEFLDASKAEKTVIGVDMDLAKAIADKMGVKLKIEDSNFTALLSSLTAGKVDIAIAGINATEERKKTMDFSTGYLPTHEKVLIRKDDAGKYKTIEDLTGKTIGVQKSTTEEKLAQDELKQSKLVALDHVPDVVLELKHGKIDGVVVQDIIAQQYLVFNDDLMLSDINFKTSKEMDTVVAVPKGNPELLKVINEVIKENAANGNFEKWLQDASKKAVENAKK
ncbi:transporter substrate-binding domain-containing protein [uncultured Dialister sp.]|uniref:transporter substrate-binding domain-containing protein n=1 Tax=uncultured Dialister sp. TaxID=278064 RepID=UPI002600A5B8|nr:transporter substrate-binding domain-containing protein [uncultured Dialister sp.]